MKMFGVAIVVLLLSMKVEATTPVIFVDGKIQFAVAIVDVEPVFCACDIDAVVALHHRYGAAGLVAYVQPSEWEINLSTCPASFSGYSDYVACLTKEGTHNKVVELRLKVMTDPENIDWQERLNWLLSYEKELTE